MSDDPKNTIIPLQFRAEQRQKAQVAASIPEPRFPGTGTSRISAMLAEAKARDFEERRQRLSAEPPRAGRPAPRG